MRGSKRRRFFLPAFGFERLNETPPKESRNSFHSTRILNLTSFLEASFLSFSIFSLSKTNLLVTIFSFEIRRSDPEFEGRFFGGKWSAKSKDGWMIPEASSPRHVAAYAFMNVVKDEMSAILCERQTPTAIPPQSK